MLNTTILCRRQWAYFVWSDYLPIMNKWDFQFYFCRCETALSASLDSRPASVASRHRFIFNEIKTARRFLVNKKWICCVATAWEHGKVFNSSCLMHLVDLSSLSIANRLDVHEDILNHFLLCLGAFFLFQEGKMAADAKWKNTYRTENEFLLLR